MKTRATPKKVKLSKADLWRQYGLQRPPKPRYEGLKGVYWYLLSQYVRRRDFAAYHRCISCNKWANDWAELQAGHFIAAGTGGFALLFDQRNVNGECGYCNGFDENHLVGYERGLDDRYGEQVAEDLKQEYLASRAGTPQKGWSDMEYDARIKGLQVVIKSL